MEELIREMAARFLEEESSGISMITVTRVETSKDKKEARIFFTVLPQEKEKAALDFAKRKSGLCRDYIVKHTRIGRPPRVKFFIDQGEKNRQRIDFLSQND